MSDVKAGLIERLQNKEKGVCKTCANLVRFVEKNAFACAAHDKLIMPKYPPYIHESSPCKDWKEQTGG